MPETDAWDVPSTPNVAAVSGALGGPAAPTPLGGPSPDVMARLRTRERPVAVPAPVVAPEPDTNLTLARQQREKGENPARDPNAQNPFSSAGGNNQIIDQTWLDLMGKYHPEMVQGQSKEQVLALKTNGHLNDEMAAKYDEDNARFLASNGIAPTPNFINAAYRAGPQGALTLIQAARQDPNALVKDVVPALNTPGNNGAGNMTVGQFLLSPYAHGPGASEHDTPQQMYTIARGNQILAGMLQDEEAGKTKVAKIDKDYKPLEIGKPPEPPVTDPLKQFSTVAGLFATLAAGFSRTPAIAAMNGLAGAMDAAKKNDWETYKAQYDQFKTNSELAIKAHEVHSQDVKDALEMMTKNMAAGTAMLQATISLSDDEENHRHLQIGDYLAIGRRNDEADEQARKWKLEQPVYEATAQLTAAMHNRDDAVKAGDPEAVKAADALVVQAENKVAEVKRALSGGGKALTPQAIAVQKFIEANPNATGEDIQKFTLGFKENAPGVTAFKERVEAERNRHSERMEQITEDRNISANDRANRALEEKIRHYKAIEEGVPTTPDEKAASAAQAATGMPLTQITPGYGPAAVNERKRLHQDAIKVIMDETGANPADAGIELANRTIEFQSGKRSSGQLTTMLGATRQAVDQLDFNIDKTKQEMAKLGSTDLSPLLNALARGEERWTGNPAYASLYYYMHATAMESARILSGGQASIAQLNQGAADEAAKWASINMTPASFDSVAKAMKDEGAARVHSYQVALEAQRVPPARVQGQQQSTAPTPLPPAALKSLQTGHETTFGNGQVWTLMPDGQPKRVR